MAELIYFCNKENNTCPKRDGCKRYLQSDDKECKTNLFKVSCTEKNNYALFIKKEGE